MNIALSGFLLPLALALIGAATSVAFAGEYFEKDGVAIRGHDPVAYFNEGRPVKGSAEHRFEIEAACHLGHTRCVSRPANRCTC